MEDNTLNQEQTATEPSEEEGYFDDFDLSDVEITPDPAEPNEKEITATEEGTEDKTEGQQPVDAPFLDIRYNKEDVHLNKDQAIEYAQKGMNYDKLNERYSHVNGQLEELARRNGIGVDEFMDKLFATQDVVEIQNELDILKEQFPDTNEEALKELAQSRVAQRRGESLRETQNLKEEQENAQREAIGNDIQELLDLYPNLTIDDVKAFPKEIWQKMDENGKSLVYNYGVWRNKQAELNKPQIEAKQRAQQLNVQNQQRDIGSTTNVNTAKVDNFLAGWNED